MTTTTTIILILATVITAWSLVLWRRMDGEIRCGLCREPLTDGWYEDQEDGDRFCTMACAHMGGADWVEWEEQEE